MGEGVSLPLPLKGFPGANLLCSVSSLISVSFTREHVSVSFCEITFSGGVISASFSGELFYYGGSILSVFGSANGAGILVPGIGTKVLGEEYCSSTKGKVGLELTNGRRCVSRSGMWGLFINGFKTPDPFFGTNGGGFEGTASAKLGSTTLGHDLVNRSVAIAAVLQIFTRASTDSGQPVFVVRRYGMAKDVIMSCKRSRIQIQAIMAVEAWIFTKASRRCHLL